MHIQNILLPKLHTCISSLNLYTYILEVFCFPKIIYTHFLLNLYKRIFQKSLLPQKNYISCVSKYLATQITFKFNKVFFGEVSCHLNIYLGEALFAIYMQHTYILWGIFPPTLHLHVHDEQHSQTSRCNANIMVQPKKSFAGLKGNP